MGGPGLEREDRDRDRSKEGCVALRTERKTLSGQAPSFLTVIVAVGNEVLLPAWHVPQCHVPGPHSDTYRRQLPAAVTLSRPWPVAIPSTAL